MNFSVPSEVLDQTGQMLLAQQTVMQNRARINRLYNGEAPATEEERRAECARQGLRYFGGSCLSNAF